MTGKSSRKKPAKPYPDYPLTPRIDGRWQKKIRGRVHYFVGTWKEALETYLRDRDYLAAGVEPPGVNDTDMSVRDLCNRFLASKEESLHAGDISQRTWDEYFGSCRRMIAVFGTRPISAVLPADFARLRADMEQTLGPVRIGNEITRVRSVFLFGQSHGLLDRLPVYGDRFKRPSARTVRRHRRQKGSRLFQPAEIHALLDAASLPMRAMILLGVNCGMGNADCGQMELSHLYLQGGWIDYPRPKTEIERRGKLWPETVAALNTYLAARQEPKSPALTERVFLTKRGLSWHKSTPDNPVAKEFRKLAQSVEVYRPGLTFYSLRHTFETVAGDTGDQVAVNYVMGHADATMAGVYRETVFDRRLEKLADHVHGWLY